MFNYSKIIVLAFISLISIPLLFAENVEQSTYAFSDHIDERLSELKSKYHNFETKNQELRAQEKIFESYHNSIKKLKSASDIVSTIKLNHQYEIFQAQAKSLENLRNKKAQAKLLLELSRDQLLKAIDDELNKKDLDISKQQTLSKEQVRQLTALYELHKLKESKLNDSSLPISIPNSLDSDTLLALEDLLVGVDKSIQSVQSSLKHMRRKKFINKSIRDTIAEESFFSESQFIHSGNVNRSNELGVNALKDSESPAENESGETDVSEEQAVEDLGIESVTNINIESTARSISSIEAKRISHKQNYGDSSDLNSQSSESLKNRLIFLQAERLKILNELQKNR